MSGANFYNEWDAKTAAWLRELINQGALPPGDVDDRSVADVDPSDLVGYDQCHFFAGVGGWSYAIELAGWDAARPVWTASLPCQPFSAAGKQRGTEDERHLWPVFRDLVEQCRPAVVVGEQVASKAGRAWFAAVQADLEALGYSTGAADLCAAGVGAPHIRQRLYWCAVRREGELPVAGSAGVPEVVEERSGSVGGMAYLETGRRGQVHQLAGRGGEGSGAQGGERPERCCGACGMAVSNGGHSCAEREQRSGEQRLQPTLRGDGVGVGDPEQLGPGWNPGTSTEAEGGAPVRAIGDATGPPSTNGVGLANDDGAGLERPRRDGEGGNEPRWVPARENGSDCAVGSPWSDVTYRPCADGKARPIKPGIEPLVNGLPGRVGLLRGYGNAIVPQVAAVFIRSVMETLDT